MMAEPKREKTIKVRCTDDEYEELRQRCPKARLAEWMREHCLTPEGGRSRPSKAPESVDPALLRQLAGIGNNLNQVARRVNSGEWAAIDRVQVIAALAAVERELAKLRAQQQ